LAGKELPEKVKVDEISAAYNNEGLPHDGVGLSRYLGDADLLFLRKRCTEVEVFWVAT
jgi:hypothetical protein